MSIIGRSLKYILASLDPNSSYHSNIIASKMTELRKLVLVNKEILIALRTNLDKPDIRKEVRKLVLVNKEILIALRNNFDKPHIMKEVRKLVRVNKEILIALEELLKRLQNVDIMLHMMATLVVFLNNKPTTAMTTTTIVPYPEGGGGQRGETGTRAKTVDSRH